MILALDNDFQPLATSFFNQSLTKNRLVRAFLLTGKALPEKLELIKAINKILNCKSNQGKDSYQSACNTCTNCKWIEQNSHPRTPIFLRAEEDSHKANIKVEQIRELQSELAQSSDYFRIIIIEDASSKALNKHSATALLKTIEEAKPNTIFMLLADSKDSVLPTIISRSQLVSFNNTEIAEYSDKSKELNQELLEWFNSGKTNSRLEQIIQAEKISEEENLALIETLSLMQDDFALELSDKPEQSQKVLNLESAINDLRSFVRPRMVLDKLFREFATIH